MRTNYLASAQRSLFYSKKRLRASTVLVGRRQLVEKHSRGQVLHNFGNFGLLEVDVFAFVYGG